MGELDTSTIVVSWTRRVATWGERQGVSIAPLLAAAGIDRATLADPTGRIPFARHADFVARLAQRVDDPGLGLSIGADASAADFGVVGLLAESSATLGEALVCVRRWNALANEASRMDYWVDGDRLVITDGHHRDGRPVPGPLAEATLAFYGAMIRGTCGVREPFAEIWFAHPRHRGWTRERRDHFAANVRFDRPLNALVLPSDLLDARFVSARPDIGAHLTALAERLERDLGAPSDLCSRVAAHVRRTLPRGPDPIDRAARALGTSVRSLQRRLEQEGRSYGEIVDEVRRSVVDDLLRGSELTLDEIAERAGYSDPRALRRSCVRWFGATPAARREHGAGG
jgi:AraC-like DNA-binding protein